MIKRGIISYHLEQLEYEHYGAIQWPVESLWKISMKPVGKGEQTTLWRSVKYEWIYLHVYENGTELYNGLEEYFRFYI